MPICIRAPTLNVFSNQACTVESNGRVEKEGGEVLTLAKNKHTELKLTTTDAQNVAYYCTDMEMQYDIPYELADE